MKVRKDNWDHSIETSVRLAKSRGLISYSDLPKLWQRQPLIHKGYVFTPSLRSAALTPFGISNETANIWTHLAPGFVVGWYALYATPPIQTFRDGPLAQGRFEDAAIAAAFYLAALAALVCSVFWHTFCCVARPRLHTHLLAADYTAIGLLISAFGLVFSHLAFYDDEALRTAYLLSGLAWAVAGLVLPWSNLIRRPDVALVRLPLPLSFYRAGSSGRLWARVIFYSLHSCQAIALPAVHAGSDRLRQPWSLTATAVAPLCIGVLFYVLKLPERLWPGRFDYFGSSHNIWHVATAVCIIKSCKILLPMFEGAWMQSGLGAA